MRRILLPFATAALLAGCAQNTRNDSLATALNAYGNAVRWDGLQSSHAFVDPDVLKAHPPTDFAMRRYQQLRVTDYDDGAGPVPLSDGEVQQTVKIDVVNIHTQVERSIVVHQVWRYDDKARRWWLESGMPDLGQN